MLIERNSALAGVQYDFFYADYRRCVFQRGNNKCAVTPPFTTTLHGHVTNLSAVFVQPVQAPDGEGLTVPSAHHPVNAAVIRFITFTPGLLPGCAQDAPAQLIISLPLRAAFRRAYLYSVHSQAKTTQVVAMYFTPFCKVTARCSWVQKGGNSTSLPCSGLICKF